jgi:hypothetical protein
VVAVGDDDDLFWVTTPCGTPISDSRDWIERFLRHFGSLYICYGTDICNWHRDFAHAFNRRSEFRILPACIRLLLVLLLLLSYSRTARGQSDLASVSGTITDQSGAVVSDVSISLRNMETGSEQVARTGVSGTYFISNIGPGSYSLRLSKIGFATIERRGMLLQVNQSATIDFILVPGAPQQVVTVSGEISTVESSTAELGTVITGRSVSDLPLNGRNFTQLLTLTPGISPVSVGQNATPSFASNPLGLFTFPSVNGQRNRSNMFLLDGVNDLALLSTYNYPPIVDDIQEFKVQSHNDLAEFGQAAGGIVNVATKGGTNVLHVSLWEFLRNEQLDARNYFLTKRNPLRQNQFGASIGGPVVLPRIYRGQGRTLFFFAYEGFRQSQSTQSTVLAPTAAQLGGDFSNLLAQGIQVYNPFSTRPDPANPGEYLRDPFPNNNISQYLSSAALLYAKTLLPVGSTPVTGGNLYDTTRELTNQDNFSGRIDQNFGTHDVLFGRVSNFNQPSSSSAGFPGALNQVSLSGWNIAAHEVHIFNPETMIDLRFARNLGDDTQTKGFTHAPSDFVNQLINAGFSSKYISDFSSAAGPFIPLITIAGYTSTSGSNIQDTQAASTYEVGGDFTRIAGRHTLKTGYSYQTDAFVGPNVGASEATSSFQTSNLENPRGTSGNGTGDALASFLLGVPNSATRRDVLEDLHGGFIQGAYVQDQFKASTHLTLNLGIRYDVGKWPIYGSFGNGQGYLGDLDLSNGEYVISGMPSQCSSAQGAPCIPGGTLPANVVMTTNHDHGIHHTDFSNWQARLGFAYRLRESLSIRGGYGRFYDEWSGFTQIAQNIGGTWPSIGAFNINSENVNIPTASIADPLSLGAGTVFLPSNTPFTNASYYFNPRIKTPFTDQWNLGLDQGFGKFTTFTLAYAGSHSSRLDNGGINNTARYPGPGDAATVASRQPYPYIVPTHYDDSTGNSNYNALEVRLLRTEANGLSFLLSYTWSKSIDLGCSGSFGVEGCSIQNPYDPQADRSVSGFDLTNIFSGSLIYALPFGQGSYSISKSTIIDQLIRHWQLNSIVTLNSGTPYYVTYSGDLANIGNTFVKVNVVGDPVPSHRSPSEWINSAAFSTPAPYTFGSMGRNSLRSDWNRNLDLSVFRMFPMHDRVAMEFRMEAFNLTNTAVFAAPNKVINAPNFGVVTSTSNTPRQLQAALKLTF